MTTERELSNARRDYDRQTLEATPGWWRTLWRAVRDLAHAISDDLARRPRARRGRLDRKEAIERAARERL